MALAQHIPLAGKGCFGTKIIFPIAHIIYLIDFGVPKMVILDFLLGVIRRGVAGRRPKARRWELGAGGWGA